MSGRGRAFRLPPAPPFVAIGLDPTAGTWASGMERGDKPMTSAALAVERGAARLLGITRHLANAEVFRRCRALRARVLAIDGPCATNGLVLGRRGWDLRRRGAVRDAEAALAREGFALFWTTHATVARFDGASRWIARSLRLFQEEAAPRGLSRIEVYPHGAFAALAAALGRPGSLPRKSAPDGRAARLELLRAVVAGADARALPDHDAVDATCAALVGALHVLGLTRRIGTARGGGVIWMPDAAATAALACERMRGRSP